MDGKSVASRALSESQCESTAFSSSVSLLASLPAVAAALAETLAVGSSSLSDESERRRRWIGPLPARLPRARVNVVGAAVRRRRLNPAVGKRRSSLVHGRAGAPQAKRSRGALVANLEPSAGHVHGRTFTCPHLGSVYLYLRRSETGFVYLYLRPPTPALPLPAPPPSEPKTRASPFL